MKASNVVFSILVLIGTLWGLIKLFGPVDAIPWFLVIGAGIVFIVIVSKVIGFLFGKKV